MSLTSISRAIALFAAMSLAPVASAVPITETYSFLWNSGGQDFRASFTINFESTVTELRNSTDITTEFLDFPVGSTVQFDYIAPPTFQDTIRIGGSAGDTGGVAVGPTSSPDFSILLLNVLSTPTLFGLTVNDGSGLEIVSNNDVTFIVGALPPAQVAAPSTVLLLLAGLVAALRRSRGV